MLHSSCLPDSILHTLRQPSALVEAKYTPSGS